jgi:hypothetical protein
MPMSTPMRAFALISLAVMAAVPRLAAEEPGAARDTLSFAVNDAYSLGLQSVWMAPLGTALSPRVEAEWRGLSLAFGFVGENKYGFYSANAVLMAEAGAGLRAGPWRPRMGLGLAWAAYNPRFRFEGNFLTEYFFASPLRFAIPLGRGFAFEASALELRYGPIFPGPLPGWYRPGDFFFLADVVRIGIRMDLALGGSR